MAAIALIDSMSIAPSRRRWRPGAYLESELGISLSTVPSRPHNVNRSSPSGRAPGLPGRHTSLAGYELARAARRRASLPARAPYASHAISTPPASMNTSRAVPSRPGVSVW